MEDFSFENLIWWICWGRGRRFLV